MKLLLFLLTCLIGTASAGTTDLSWMMLSLFSVPKMPTFYWFAASSDLVVGETFTAFAGLANSTVYETIYTTIFPDSMHQLLWNVLYGLLSLLVMCSFLVFLSVARSLFALIKDFIKCLLAFIAYLIQLIQLIFGCLVYFYGSLAAIFSYEAQLRKAKERRRKKHRKMV